MVGDIRQIDMLSELNNTTINQASQKQDTLKLTKTQAELYTALVEALDTVSDNLNTKFHQFASELEKDRTHGDDDDYADEDYERDVSLGIFQFEVEELNLIVDKVLECQSTLESFKRKFNLDLSAA